MGPREALVSCKQVGIARGVSATGLANPAERKARRHSPGGARGPELPAKARFVPRSQRAFEGFPPFPLTCGALSVFKAAGFFYRELSQN